MYPVHYCAGSKTKGTAAYYLPLFRVERALALLRPACPEGGPAAAAWLPVDIPRGTLQTTFAYKGFDECRRLGLRRETVGRNAGGRVGRIRRLTHSCVLYHVVSRCIVYMIAHRASRTRS